MDTLVKPTFAQQQVKNCENLSVAEQLAESIFGYMETGKVYEIILDDQKIVFARLAIKRWNSRLGRPVSSEELTIYVRRSKLEDRQRFLLTDHLSDKYKNWSIKTPDDPGLCWVPLVDVEVKQEYLLLLLLCADKLWKLLDVRENSHLRALGRLGFSVDNQAIENAASKQLEFLNSLGG